MYAYGGLIRVVEPHLLGEAAGGDALLSGWLRPGYSRSDPQGGWRSWRVDRISSAQLLDQQFPGPRPGYNPADPRMLRVTCALSAAALVVDERSPAPGGSPDGGTPGGGAPDDVAPDAVEPQSAPNG